MSLVYKINGATILDRVRLRDEGEGYVTAAELGSIGTGGVLIDDPNGDLTINGWQSFTIDDTGAGSYQRVFTGYIVDRQISRGSRFRTAAGRVHSCTVLDQNALLRVHVLRANAAKRPAETDVTRVAWLLTSEALSGLVTDEGLVSASNAGSFLASDTRRRFADDVLNEMAPSAVKNFFVYRDHASGNAALFYDKNTASVWSTSIKVSNVAADVDGTTVFAPTVDASLTRTPEEQYGGVSYGWLGPAIYVTSATTIAAMGFTRDAVYDTNRVGLLATAQQAAKDWLNVRATETDIVSFEMVVPSSVVTSIEAGMEMQVKFSHLPGYSSYVWRRIRRRRAIPETDGTWRLAIELWAVPTPVTDAADVTVCDTNFALGKTWIVTQSGPGSPMSTNSGEADLSDGVTDTSSGQFAAGGHVTSGSGLYTFRFAVDLGSAQSVTEVKLWWWSLITFDTARVYYSDTGTSGAWTEVTSGTPSSPSTSLTFSAISHRYWSVTLEHYYVDLTYWTALASDAYSLTEIEIFGCTVEAPTPSVGSWVTESLGLGDGSTVAWVTTDAFVPGTLIVRVDHLDQTAAVTVTDASAGTFTLAFAPTSSEQVDVTYQVA